MNTIFEILAEKDRDKWNEIVLEFSRHDVYYLYEYVAGLTVNNSSIPMLFYYCEPNFKACLAVLLNDIATDSKFSKIISCREYYDIETPYGYGGPLFQGRVSNESINRFFEKIKAYCIEKKIVSIFYRYHPLNVNPNVFRDNIEIKYCRKSIYMDVSSEEVIWKNIDTKNRNMIRKAQKNGVKITCDKGEHLTDFINIYNETMDRNQASDFYYFKKEYYDYMIEKMREHLQFFYALYEEKIVSASIILYDGEQMHYHLSGTRTKYRQLASTNLLLYEAALWGSRNKKKTFHLGGGVKDDDGLYRFKKQFNKNDELYMYIGRSIFLPEKYKELMQIRKKVDLKFDDNNNFFIQYRY